MVEFLLKSEEIKQLADTRGGCQAKIGTAFVKSGRSFIEEE
mgnify:FL=1